MQHGESLPPTNPSLKNGRLVYCLPKTCSNATFLAVQGGSIFVSSKTVYCRKLLQAGSGGPNLAFRSIRSIF